MTNMQVMVQLAGKRSQARNIVCYMVRLLSPSSFSH